MPERNDLLRAARTRVESSGSPHEPMTRQELADAINDHVFRSTGKRSAVNANHVGKWERGITSWPTTRYRAALRAVLDVATDAELGLRRPQRVTVESVDRKTFIKATLGVSAGAIVARNTASRPPVLDLVDSLSGPIGDYRRMESAVPSDQLAPAVDAYLTLASGVVQDRLRNATGSRILSEISGLAAWLAVDRGDHATARRRYVEAIRHAERTSHPLLVSYMTASFGHFAVEAGNPRVGLDMLTRASAQLDSYAPDTARAWLASLHAVAHAALGDQKATATALLTADKLTDRQSGEPQWPWVFTFDGAKAARYQAGAFARLGALRPATRAYVAASPALTAAKPRALAQIEHAQLLAKTGEIASGCALAIEALSTGQAYGSERVTNRVREFRAALPVRTTEAASLDDALAALYEQDNG